MMRFVVKKGQCYVCGWEPLTNDRQAYRTPPELGRAQKFERLYEAQSCAEAVGGRVVRLKPRAPKPTGDRVAAAARRAAGRFDGSVCAAALTALAEELEAALRGEGE